MGLKEGRNVGCEGEGWGMGRTSIFRIILVYGPKTVIKSKCLQERQLLLKQ